MRPWPAPALLGLALVAALAACRGGGRAAPPPAPRGTPYHDYLQDGAAATGRPSGTSEREAMRLHVIDVGQGLAALIELPCGAVLVDTGGELNERFDGVAALVRYLDAFFERRRDLRRRLDLLVVTHPHLDHTRGIAEVVRRYAVANVIDNGDVREEPGGVEQLALHAWLAKQRKIGHFDVAAASIRDEGLTSPVIDPIGACEGAAIDPIIRVLWGGPLGREEIGHDPNDDSVVLRIDFGQASLIIGGDLERLGIARLMKKFARRPEVLDADVFVVPHHGSKHSTASALIAKVTPKVAVVSAGPYDRSLGLEQEYTARAFGHPSRAAVDDLLGPGGVSLKRDPVRVMLGLRGAWKTTPSEFEARTIDRAIYATGWDGDVVVTAWDNGWVEVTTGHPPPPVVEAPAAPAAPAGTTPAPPAAATPTPTPTGATPAAPTKR